MKRQNESFVSSDRIWYRNWHNGVLPHENTKERRKSECLCDWDIFYSLLKIDSSLWKNEVQQNCETCSDFFTSWLFHLIAIPLCLTIQTCMNVEKASSSLLKLSIKYFQLHFVLLFECLLLYFYAVKASGKMSKYDWAREDSVKVKHSFKHSVKIVT